MVSMARRSIQRAGAAEDFSLTAPPRPYPGLVERIAANVALWWPERPGPDWDGTPCELWLGGRNGSGYPQFCVRAKHGKHKGKPRKIAVHRAVLKHNGAPVRKGNKAGMHLCNESLCVCRSHLRYGTAVENELYKFKTNEFMAAKNGREPGDDDDE